MQFYLKIIAKTFGGNKKKSYLCSVKVLWEGGLDRDPLLFIKYHNRYDTERTDCQSCRK